MVEDKVTATGSIDLKESLPYGTVKKIAIAFDKTLGFVNDVVKGNRDSKLLIVECAERIAEAYEDCGFEDSLDTILQDYNKPENR